MQCASTRRAMRYARSARFRVSSPVQGVVVMAFAARPSAFPSSSGDRGSNRAERQDDADRYSWRGLVRCCLFETLLEHTCRGGGVDRCPLVLDNQIWALPHLWCTPLA